MLTLFALPKPFAGHIGVIQRNAIRSWTLLQPRPQIILMGDEHGTADCAEEFGLRHVAEVVRNEYGTPLISDIFGKARQGDPRGLLCYVNSDIILMRDFMTAIGRVPGRRGFLMAAQRWDLDVPEPLTFGADWEAGLRERVALQGHLDPPGSIDFFLFPERLYGDIPPFALGRFYWDNWLLYQARRRGATLVDATPSVMIVHQRHGYHHVSLGEQGVQNSDGTLLLRDGPEGLRNLALAGGEPHLYTLQDATHRLTAQGLTRRRLGRRRVERWQITWNSRSRQALGALEGAARPASYFGYPARALLGLIQAMAPARQSVGRGLVSLRDRGKDGGGETT